VLLVRAEQAQPLTSGYPRRILVPLDGSAMAESAVQLALRLAGRARAEIILAHIVTTPHGVPGDEAEGSHGFTEAGAHAYLQDVRRRLTEPGVPVRTDIRAGEVAEGIVAVAECRGADLIVASTHGRGGLDRWVHGSIADRLVRGASVPVLLVRADLAMGARALVPTRA
jgi:nucleotide-binding universal stress UspA family protein